MAPAPAGKDVALRATGLLVHRYSRDRVEQTPDTVAADVIAALARGDSR